MKMRGSEHGLPFVLELAEDNRVTMASIYYIQIPAGAITVNEIPDEGHPISAYRYEDGNFIFDPLPSEPELELVDPGPNDFDILEAQVTYTAMVTKTLLEV